MKINFKSTALTSVIGLLLATTSMAQIKKEKSTQDTQGDLTIKATQDSVVRSTKKSVQKQVTSAEGEAVKQTLSEKNARLNTPIKFPQNTKPLEVPATTPNGEAIVAPTPQLISSSGVDPDVPKQSTPTSASTEPPTVLSEVSIPKPSQASKNVEERSKSNIAKVYQYDADGVERVAQKKVKVLQDDWSTITESREPLQVNTDITVKSSFGTEYRMSRPFKDLNTTRQDRSPAVERVPSIGITW